jgi:hypothetical protein
MRTGCRLGLGLDLVVCGGHFQGGWQSAPSGEPSLVLGPPPAPSSLLLSCDVMVIRQAEEVRNSP